MTLTGRHILEARELLGWSRADLARNAFLPLAVVEVVEEHGSAFMLMDTPGLAIWRVLGEAGVEIGAEGLRLRKGEA